MKTLAYQLGWDRADVITDHNDSEYVPKLNTEKYSKEMGKILFVSNKEIKEFKQGMDDFLVYKKKRDEVRERKELKREERNRKEHLSSIKEQNKNFSLLDLAFFLMCLFTGKK